PVDAAYNGQIVTILHCVNGILQTYTTTVADGKAVFTVTGLSPFAVFAGAAKTIGVPNTGGGGGLPLWPVLLLFGAFCGYLPLRRREKRI
ncbi:MAG: hypothetical protein LLF87_12435, partial [Eubacteriales bacterium]|nr:hypothetical protein [Eubacteriales bacterium]